MMRIIPGLILLAVLSACGSAPMGAPALSPTPVSSPAPVPIPAGTPSIGFSASAYSVTAVGSIVLTVTAVNATEVTISGTDGTFYTLPAIGGKQTVTVAATTTYTAKASGVGGCVSAAITIPTY